MARTFPVTLYDREDGPICFETPLWKRICYLPEQLLSSGLTWRWRSLRTAPPSAESPVQGLPDERTWTRLDYENHRDLLADFHEWNVDGDLRDIFILGFDPDLGPAFGQEAIQDAASAFVQERGSLQVVIVSLHDWIAQRVFVRHEDKRTSAADQLLRSWYLTTLPPTKKHRYGRLRVAQIEKMLPFP